MKTSGISHQSKNDLMNTTEAQEHSGRSQRSGDVSE